MPEFLRAVRALHREEGFAALPDAARLEKLATDEAGVASYDGVPFMTTKGAVTSSLKKANIK